MTDDSTGKRRLIAIAIGVFFVLVVVIAAIVNIAKPWLSGDPHVRKEVSAVSSTNDFTVSDALVVDGEWKLYRVNPLREGVCEPGPVIMKGNERVIGPATDVHLDDLYKAGVPDKLVRYIFKKDVLWYGFETYERSYVGYSPEYIRASIQALAMRLNIKLDKIMLNIDSIKNYVNDPRGVNRTEVGQFNFTLNNDKTKYTLTATNFTTINKITINIDDEDGQTLFNKTFDAL